MRAKFDTYAFITMSYNKLKVCLRNKLKLKQQKTTKKTEKNTTLSDQNSNRKIVETESK